MPAHSRGNQPPLQYYARVLLALSKREGGELRIKCSDVDRINEKMALSIDFDAESGELVIRSGSQFLETLYIEPEQMSWTRPLSDRPEATPTQTPARTSMLTDAQVAEIESGLLRRAAQRKQANQSDQPNTRTPRVS